jgi:serine protease inhibitor
VDALIGDFTAENWDEWMAGFGDKRGAIFLPKFELDYELLLNDALIRLGMGIAFMEGQADFTGMREDGGLFISNVIHKTYVRVDEEGTEAAAVTVVEMAEVSIDSFVMKVDRPFIFAIREKHSDTILFIGRMMNPTAGV